MIFALACISVICLHRRGAGGSGGDRVVASLGLLLVGASAAGFSQTAAGTEAGALHARTKNFVAYHAFGDSITACCTVTSTAALYAQRIAQDYGLPLTNDGVPGDQACDTSLDVLSVEDPDDESLTLTTLMIGSNDANTAGAGAYEPVYRLCHLASLSWLAIPSTVKVMAQSPVVKLKGPWTRDDSFRPGLAIQSTTNGSTATFPISTTGGPVYLWYRISDQSSGRFTCSVDGGPGTVVNSYTTPAIATLNGGTSGVGLLRLSNIAAGSHLLKVTVTSATSSANAVDLLAAGTAPAQGDADGPIVFAGGVPFQLNDRDSAATAAYNSDALADIAELVSDGLAVVGVDVRSFLHGKPVEMGSYLHPNDLGHAELRDAFEAEIQAPLVPIVAPAGGSYPGAQKVTMTDAMPGAVIHYTLDGTAPTASSAVYSTPLSIDASATVNAIAVVDGKPASAVTSVSYLLPGSLQVSSRYISFQPQLAGTTATEVRVVLKNTGKTAVRLLGTSISGLNAADFAKSVVCASTIAPGASCSVPVTFAPLATGQRSATLNFRDTDPSSPQSVTLVGFGASGTMPEAHLSTTVLDFGPVTVGTRSSAQVVTLTNVGNAPMSYFDKFLAGNNAADFHKVTVCAPRVVPGATCTVTLTFVPSATGVRTAVVGISDNSSSSPQLIQLSGTGQ